MISRISLFFNILVKSISNYKYPRGWSVLDSIRHVSLWSSPLSLTEFLRVIKKMSVHMWRSCE